MIVGFDLKAFNKKCHPASQGHDSTIDFDIVANELFKVHEVWDSRDTRLLCTLNELSNLHGYHIKVQDRGIYCNRAGKSCQSLHWYLLQLVQVRRRLQAT